jgi:DNA processing protein
MSHELSEVASSAAIEHLRWALTTEVGPITFARLIDHFGSAQAALGASETQLRGVDGIGPTLSATIARSRDDADVQREVTLAAEHGVRILCREDEAYPVPLRHIPDPPICLYVRGTLEPADSVAIAIVGARRCTHYGREQAFRFGYQLAQRGMTVVSGLARGADGEAHKGALTAGGRTIAVLGNGLTSIYPPEHRDLADRVSESGAVVSALPMGTSPSADNFLPRNRIIAGLSLGVLVIEAGRRSGSLSTAARAADYNREVFAIPGRVDSDSSYGTNALIRDQHAKLVMSPDDILDELGEAGEILAAPCADAEKGPSLFDGQGNAADTTRRIELSDDERAVLEQLGRQERSIEVIAAEAGRPCAKVASTLISLQLKGLARQLPGNVFVSTRRA